MKKKNSASYKKLSSFSYKKLSVFSFRNYKIILRSFVIMSCAFSIIMALEVQACAKTAIQILQGWSGVGHAIFLLPVLIWLCLLTSFSILWGIHSIRERKLNKTKQQGEQATEQDESVQG